MEDQEVPPASLPEAMAEIAVASAAAAEPLFSEDTSPPLPPPRPAGPGFWESLCWLVGVPIVQAVAFVIAGCGLAAIFVVTHPHTMGAPDFDITAFTREAGPFIERHFAVILGAAGMATVLYGAGAVSLRLRR
ncbi:MAG TPA: hypothetical protein VL475_00690, partial [Planctomycetaceae bacterium]|nr:hypothetical protein [Planctomycetaceae bacterium]